MVVTTGRACAPREHRHQLRIFALAQFHLQRLLRNMRVQSGVSAIHRLRRAWKRPTCKLCVATLPLIVYSTFGDMFVSGNFVGFCAPPLANPRGSYLHTERHSVCDSSIG